VRPAVRDLVADHLDWTGWEALIEQRGITIDRPRHYPHPRYPEIIYPLDYGYVNGTLGTDGQGLDVFVGTAAVGLVGAILTTDHRQHDREIKLLYRCAPAEIYTAHGFINFDRQRLEGLLVLRHSMHALWTQIGVRSP